MFQKRQDSNYDKLTKKYKEYLALYKAINHGSLAGVTSFEEFYYRLTYYAKYHERAVHSHAV